MTNCKTNGGYGVFTVYSLLLFVLIYVLTFGESNLYTIVSCLATQTISAVLKIINVI